MEFKPCRRTAQRALSAVLSGLLALLLVASARAADPHRLFEARCGACHDDHAGAFARESLTIVGGVVRGARSGRDIAAFLPRHGGGLAPDEVALLLDLFRRQIGWAGLFQARCRMCHDSARSLARQRLIVRDGVLRGRYTGRDIARFLERHGRTTADERQVLHEVLLWQLEAAGGSD